MLRPRRRPAGPTCSSAELQLQVSDDRAGEGSERLAGLRDRVGLYGGHLGAGRIDSGGFRLWATLPLEGRG
jgi:hypothetical protein